MSACRTANSLCLQEWTNKPTGAAAYKICRNPYKFWLQQPEYKYKPAKTSYFHINTAGAAARAKPLELGRIQVSLADTSCCSPESKRKPAEVG